MLYRYQRYIARNLTHSLLLITVSLTGIIWLTQALRFLDFIIDQGMQVSVFLELTSMLLPSLFMMVLPAATSTLR